MEASPTRAPPLLESRREIFFLKFRDWMFRRTHDACPGNSWPLVLRFKLTNAMWSNEQAAGRDSRRSDSESWRRMYLSDSPRPVVWEVKEERVMRNLGVWGLGKRWEELAAHGMMDANSTLGDLVEERSH